MPLSDIDPRHIYVVAAPGSLLVEIHLKEIIRHTIAGDVVTETVDQRISREFALPGEIEEGSTAVQVFAGVIQITAVKVPHRGQRPWSKLIDFDLHGG